MNIKALTFAACIGAALENWAHAQQSESFAWFISENWEYIHAIMQWHNWNFASTFARDPSRPMIGEWEYRDEVCGWIQVAHLPKEIQEVINQV